jgi:DNA topoisomerase-2
VVAATVEDHARTKGMWAGALEPVEIPGLQGAIIVAPEGAPLGEGGDGDGDGGGDGEDGDGDGGGDAPPARGPGGRAQVVDLPRPHTPALLTIINEILANAADQAKTCERNPPSRRVTAITVEFDPATGRVEVTNDGPGVPVVEHAAESARAGRPVLVPEVSFGTFLAGTNINKAADCVRGGINGLGAKLANVHSEVFEVETVDAVRRLRFRQVFRDRLRVREAPRVAPERGPPFTRVGFVPAYRALGYPAPGPSAGWAAAAADLEAWARLRAHQVAAYLGPRVAVAFNGAPCGTTDAPALARLLVTALPPEVARQTLVLPLGAKAPEEPQKGHPWSLAAVVLPPGLKAAQVKAARNMLVVNGVLTNKGTHLQLLKDALHAEVAPRLAKARGVAAAAGAAGGKKGAAGKGAGGAAAPKKAPALSRKDTLGGVRFVMCGAIPGAVWKDQQKEELQVPPATLAHWALGPKALKEAAAAVAATILMGAAGKTARAFAHGDKYRPARYAGTPKREHTLLLAAEGDSAITMLKAGLTQSRRPMPPGGPSFDWCGFISLQGVVINAVREVKAVASGAAAGGGGAGAGAGAPGEAPPTVLVRSAKLEASQRLAALADAFGLRYDLRYETPAELATLKYGRLVLCVDQDLDGTGKIAPLVLAWLNTFWPALFAAGRVGRFVTPLVRARPLVRGRGGAGAGAGAGARPPAVEFIYEEECRRWVAEDPARAKTHRFTYFKGLAGHSRDDVAEMFRPEAFARALYTYVPDRGTPEGFDIYFGPRPELRKRALVTPVAHLTEAEAGALRARREIPLRRVQLDVDAKAYKLEAVARQIPGAADGLNPARRKIIAGALLRCASLREGEFPKVYQLGGAVADSMQYHHGDASLSATIVGLAQDFAGARRFPYLTGEGSFGTRHGDAAGSPRYIGARLSPLADVVLPAADRWLLPYVFEDGVRAEPRYFLPVVPMAVLESYKIPSEGWCHVSFARERGAALRAVRAFVAGEPALVAAAEALHRGEGGAVDWGALARAWPLPEETRGFLGEVRPYGGAPHSFGAYELGEAPPPRGRGAAAAAAAAAAEPAVVVTVTDLPLGVPTAGFLAQLTGPGRGGRPNPRAAYVRGVADLSTVEAVRLEVALAPGATPEALAAAGFGDAEIDPVEDLLQLRVSLAPHLNYVGARGEVLELTPAGYLAPLLYWARLRRDLYGARLRREAAVLRLRVLREEGTLRFIARSTALDLKARADVGAAEALLAAEGFRRLDHALLESPQYTPAEDLERLVTEGGAGRAPSFDYLLGLPGRELVAAAAAKREGSLAGLRRALAGVEAALAERPTPGASVWLAEVAAFEAYADRLDAERERRREAAAKL